MVKILHRILQPGGANRAIGGGVLPGHHGIHPAVAEDKQHPFGDRPRGNGGYLLLDLLAQHVAFWSFI